MSKQVHEEVGAHETLEPVAALIRQSASRAIERLRLQFTRSQANANSTTPGGMGVSAPAVHGPLTAASMRKPMDVFVIQYCMYYLDTHQLPAKHYVRLAQEVVTASVERVLVPSLFQRALSLPMLCESLVLERSAEEVQTCLKEMEEFVEAREAVGAWLTSLGDLDQPDDRYEDEGWGAYGDGSSGDRKRRAMEGGDGWPKREDAHGADEDALATAMGRHDPHGRAADGGTGAEMLSGVDIAGSLYQSLEYWLRLRGFLHAWSFSTANLHAYPMKSRYEQELMRLLGSLSSQGNRRPAAASSSAEAGSVLGIPAPAPTSTTAALAVHAPLKPEPASTSSLVKQEVRDEMDDDDETEDVAERIYRGSDEDEYGEGDEEAYRRADGSNGVHAKRFPAAPSAHVQHRRDVANTVLADVLALSECPVPPSPAEHSPTTSSSDATAVAVPLTVSASSSMLLTETVRYALRGIHPVFFTMVHARLSVMVARDHLTAFSHAAASVTAPALTRVQENVQQQQETMRAQYLAFYGAAGTGAGPGDGAEAATTTGLPLDYVPDDQYYLRLMQKVAPEEAELGEDEELFKDEVLDYYKHKTDSGAQQATPADDKTTAPRPPAARDARGRPLPRPSSPTPPKELVKPERFCRMGTGYRWTQYNRTHYDSHTNPPPRTVMWYKFTLLYPLLADTKKDMNRIFHIENTPKGPADDHCILVFSPGPPYADVAYRIVKQQWDTRRGGVNVSFDSTGRFQLFFRFSNSNYRR